MYPNEGAQEEVREGFNPDRPEGGDELGMHNTDMPFTVGEEPEIDEEEPSRDELGHDEPWETRTYDNKKDKGSDYGSFENDERDAWGERDAKK